MISDTPDEVVEAREDRAGAVGCLSVARMLLDSAGARQAIDVLRPMCERGEVAFPDRSLWTEALAIYVKSHLYVGDQAQVDLYLPELGRLFRTELAIGSDIRVRAAETLAGVALARGEYVTVLGICEGVSESELAESDADLNFGILAKKQAALYRLGRLAEAEAICGRTLALVERERDDVRTGLVWLWLGNICRARGMLTQALQMYAHATKHMRRGRDVIHLARIILNRAAVLNRIGETRESAAEYREVRILATQIGDRVTSLRAMLGVGMTELRNGEHRSARRALLAAWREARRVAASREECLALEFLAELQTVSNRTGQAVRSLRLCRRLAERIAPDGDLIAELGVRDALRSLIAGDVETASLQATSAIELCRRKGLPWEEAQAHRLLGAARALLGDSAGAIASLGEARALWTRMGERLEIQLVHAWQRWVEAGATGRSPALHPAQLEPAAATPGGSTIENPAQPSIARRPAGLPDQRPAKRRAARRAASKPLETADGSRNASGSDAASAGRSSSPETYPPRQPLHPIWTSLGLIARSRRMRQVLEEVERFGTAGVNVLILGETGTGKELLARGLHECSGRQGRFVPFNCAGCPPNLIESELFGVERGAYTGADRSRVGLIREAAGGTLFLDEVGDLRPESQGALLRFLDSGEVRALGSGEIGSVSLGVVAATLRPIEAGVRAGGFRPDLYYRLAQGYITVPPLRARRVDLVPLIRGLWRRNFHTPEPAWLFEPWAQELLRGHAWQGNVRELAHLLQRLHAQGAAGRPPAPDAFAVMLRMGNPGAATPLPDRERVLEALDRMRGNRKRAAAFLGISRQRLYRLLDKYSIDDSCPTS